MSTDTSTTITYETLTEHGRSQLVAGDQVVTGWHDGTGLEVHTVDRATDTQVTAGGRRYMVSTGQSRREATAQRVRFLLGIPGTDTALSPAEVAADAAERDAERAAETAEAAPVKDAIAARLAAAAAVVETARQFSVWAKDNAPEATRERAAEELAAAVADAQPTPDETAVTHLRRRLVTARADYTRRRDQVADPDQGAGRFGGPVHRHPYVFEELARAAARLYALEDALEHVEAAITPGSSPKLLRNALAMIRDHHLGNLLNAQLNNLTPERAVQLAAGQHVLEILDQAGALHGGA